MIIKNTRMIADLESDSFLFDVGLPSNSDQVCAETDFKKAVADVLLTIETHLKNEATVCIVVDDYTRSTPTAEILSYLMPALEKVQVKKENIFFMFASGSHRLMTEEEKRARLSDKYFENYRSMDHRFFDNDHLKQMGNFEDGAPILINKHVLEADVHIAISTLVPHMPAGFSGGAKMLLPGVAGEDTVHHMHVVGALDPKQAIGVTDTLPRQLMEELAKTAEPFVILNTIL